MQWFIDLIKDWVIAQAYATQAWVLAKYYTTIAEVLAEIRGTRFYARRQYSTQSIPSGTWTKVQLNNPIYDTKTEWDPVNNRLILKEAGYYMIAWGIGFRPADPPIGKIVGAVRINGAMQCTIVTYIPDPDYGGTGTAFLWLMATAHYVELWIHQASGISQNIDYTNFMNYLSIERVP